MENYDQFSQSWRDEIDRAHGRPKNKQTNQIFDASQVPQMQIIHDQFNSSKPNLPTGPN